MQTSYGNLNDKPAPFGALYEELNANVQVTFVTETDEIAFGTAVARDGTSRTKCKSPDSSGDEIVGLARFDRSREQFLASGIFGYEANAEVCVVRQGRVAVKPEVDVVAGDPVYVRVTAAGAEKLGALRNDADGGDAILLANAYFANDWLTSQTDVNAWVDINLP
jgi:hypothetical protein